MSDETKHPLEDAARDDWQRGFIYKHARMIETVIPPATPRKLGHHLARRSRRASIVRYLFTRHGERIADIRRGLL